jgi:hypothetical protein
LAQDIVEERKEEALGLIDKQSMARREGEGEDEEADEA